MSRGVRKPNRLFETREGDDGLPGPERRLAVLALILGTLMAVIDTTMIQVALPSMAASLEVPASRVVWVTNLFQISCAAFLLVFAALSKLVGRRRLYVAGVALFTLASLGAALSTSLESLLLFRALQGLGAAAMLSIGPSLYRLIFPSRLLGSALGLSALVVAAGYAAGPAIGGVVLSVADWPWLFTLHLPLGTAALLLAWRALPHEPRRPGRFDLSGALLAVATLCAFFMAMDGAGHGMPAAQVAIWMAASLSAAALFLRRQRRAPYPLLPLDIFRESRFSLALAAQGMSFVGQGLTFVALSFLFQQEMGFTPLETALMFTPWPLAIMLIGPRAGRLSDRVNPSLLASAGLGLLAVGLMLLARLDSEASVVDVLWRMALCGVGFGLFQPPNNRELIGTVPRERSANASGAMSTSRTVGQALGVALVGVFLATHLPVQAALWVGVLFTLLALGASLARMPMAGAGLTPD